MTVALVSHQSVQTRNVCPLIHGPDTLFRGTDVDNGLLRIKPFQGRPEFDFRDDQLHLYHRSHYLAYNSYYTKHRSAQDQMTRE